MLPWKRSSLLYSERQPCFSNAAVIVAIFALPCADAFRHGAYVWGFIFLGIAGFLFWDLKWLTTRIRNQKIRVRVGRIVPLFGFTIDARTIQYFGTEPPKALKSFVFYFVPGVQRKRYEGKKRYERRSILSGVGEVQSGVFIETTFQMYFIGSVNPEALMQAIDLARVTPPAVPVAEATSDVTV